MAASLALGCTARNPADGDSAPRRDVVVIVIDTLRADALGCYGATIDLPNGERVSPSPRIDALAARGVRFRDAETSSSWTLTSTVSFLSGLAPSEHGLRSKKFGALPADLRLLSDELRDAGYRASAVVCNPMLGRDVQIDARFDDYLHLRNKPADLAVDRMLGGVDGILRDEPDRPMFLYLHLLDPHWPYDPAAPEVERFGIAHSPLSYEDQARLGQKLMGGDPSAAAELVRWSRDWAHRAYLACVASTDREVGRFLDALEARGLLDDALVVVTSDHGEEFGENGSIGHARQLFTESLRVPFLIAGPGIPQGVVIDERIEVRSLAATVLARLGLQGGSKLAGIDLLDAAARGAASDGPHYSFVDFGLDPDDRTPVAGLHGLRCGDLRLVCVASGDGTVDRSRAVLVTLDERGEAIESNALADVDEDVWAPLMEKLESIVASSRPAIVRTEEEGRANRERRRRELRELGYFGAADAEDD